MTTTTETVESVNFGDIRIGDRLRFETTTDCFSGRNQVTREGIVVKVTEKTIKVEMEQGERIYGATAILRRSAWYDRQVRRVARASQTPYTAESVQVVDMGHTVWALYIPNPEDAKDPRAVADNILDRRYAGVELVATAARHQEDCGRGRYWIAASGPDMYTDPLPTKADAMQSLRRYVTAYFVR